MRETRASFTASRLHWPLFQKYFLALFIAVVVPLLVNGATEAWFGYRDQQEGLGQRLHLEAVSAAGKIDNFLKEIGGQLRWTVQLSWGVGSEDQHRLDVLRLMRQVPAIVEVTLLDGDDVERVHVSGLSRDSLNSGIDHSTDSPVRGAHVTPLWYGPVTFYEGSEPRMQIAVSGPRKASGIAVATINLKLIWDVISAIHIGRSGDAFVLDKRGRLIAHPDISLMLRSAADPAAAQLPALLNAIDGDVGSGRDLAGAPVIAARAPITGPGWTAVVEQSRAEAFAPIRGALWRTVYLLLGATIFAGIVGYWLARRMAAPIRLLEHGAKEIGTGNFQHKIEISTGDELQSLAHRFNEMAAGLAESAERSARIARLKQFLSPQVAELIEDSDHAALLDSHRTEIVVLFCDLRGFTSFAAATQPDTVMRLLQDYYDKLGSIITRYQATLTCFMADGLMLLLNAPLPCPEPAVHGVRMALDMQVSAQAMIAGWRARGHAVGFGVGLAKGMAIVGRIGYEGRSDYTAIGNVVNLAARLCNVADDGQILIDARAAGEIGADFDIVALGTRNLRGFSEPVPVFSICVAGTCPLTTAISGSAKLDD